MTTIRLHKPFDVLCQFSPQDNKPTLADLVRIKGVYAAGRLDRDSEGLLLLTDDGQLQHRITDPKHKLAKTYWVQVDGEITEAAIAKLQAGVLLKDGITQPAQATKIAEPEDLWARDPPVRFRANIPTSWLSLVITEGRNRQVRRMTAAVGFPTLRLIRYAIGSVTLDGLSLGQYDEVSEQDLCSTFSGHQGAHQQRRQSKQRHATKRRRR